MISRTKLLLIQAGNAILAVVLAYNLWRVYERQAKISEFLSGDILAADPEKLLGSIAANATPDWVWVVNIAALVITIGFAILMGLPRFRKPALFWTNLAWLAVWLIYLIGLLILVFVIFKRIF